MTVVSFLAFLAVGELFSLLGAPNTVGYIAAYLAATALVRVGERFVGEECAAEVLAFENEEELCENEDKPGEGGDAENCPPRAVPAATASPLSRASVVLRAAAVLALLLAANAVLALALGGGERTPMTPSRVAVAVLVKPFCEEMLFRVSYVALLSRAGVSKSATCAVTAVLFAALHRGTSALLALLAGVLLACLSLDLFSRSDGEKSGRRLAASAVFAVHAAYNLVLCVASAAL